MRSTGTSNGSWQSTACLVCGTNCGLELQVEENRIAKVRGDKRNPFSRGYTCSKGLTVGKLVDHKQRVTTPLKRMPDGGYTPIGWQQAISEIAEEGRNVRLGRLCQPAPPKRPSMRAINPGSYSTTT